MKKHVFFLVTLLSTLTHTYSQVAINSDGSQPNSSAMLDVSSTTKGFLAPRLTTAQRTVLSATAVDGLMVYDTDLNAYFVFKGVSWEQQLGSSSGWCIAGNSGTTAGINFLGTTDDKDLVFKVNGLNAGRISSVGTTLYGYQAGDVTTAIHNTFLGWGSGKSTTTGDYNSVIGNQAMSANTIHSRICAFGYQALHADAFSDNCAFGYQALYSTTVSGGNLAAGTHALYSNVDGPYNVALGYYAMSANVSGGYSTAIGYESMKTSTGGGNNNAVGYQSLYSNTTGSGNNAFGYFSLRNNTTGAYNSAFGNQAMSQTTSGDHNCAFGVEVLQKNSTGSFNNTMGYRCMLENTSGSSNTAFGSYAGNQNMTGSRNTIFGDSAGYANSSGNNNVFLGYRAGISETSSNKLYIDNNGSSASNSLLYGEFDNHILATNGAFGIKTTTPNSTLQVVGSFATGITGKSTDYSITENDQVVICTAAITVTLPSAVGTGGRQYLIKRNYSGGSTTLTASNSQTIDGTTTYLLTSNWKYVNVVSDGINWLIIGNN